MKIIFAVWHKKKGICTKSMMKNKLLKIPNIIKSNHLSFISSTLILANELKEHIISSKQCIGFQNLGDYKVI